MTTTYPAKIATALHEVMKACGYVQKTKRNAFHNYTYAGEGDLLDVLRPAMLNAGLLLIPSGVDRTPVDEYGNTHVIVEYTLLHKDGDVWPEKIRAFGTGNDKAKNGSIGDKGTYKALTGANKYLLFKLFQIETGDDPETEAHELPAPTREPERAPAKPQPAGIDEARQNAVSFKDKLIADIRKCGSYDDLNRVNNASATVKALAALHDRHRDLWDEVMATVARQETTIAERAAA
jgi:hypothetical protein